MSKYKFFIGIDPGLSGAVAILDTFGSLMVVHDLPTTAQGGFIKKRIDANALTTLIQPYANHALASIEVVGHRQGQGALSGASLASSMAYCEGVLAGLGIDTLRMPPALWKQAMGLTGKGKDGSISRARALTGLTLRHDQAEAILLARFAWLNREKELPEVVGEEKPKPQRRTRAKEKKQKAQDDDLGAFVAGV